MGRKIRGHRWNGGKGCTRKQGEKGDKEDKENHGGSEAREVIRQGWIEAWEVI